MIMSGTIPWVEKYRPQNFENIVLSSLNRKILNNIVNTGNFPNMLFYGPPGTGKTTTIVNLISSFQERYFQKNQSLIIHLNASDERGIEVIRNQINQFVASKPLFTTGTKFVVLDEVDYMTKNAQQALRYLLQDHQSDVRFCLICNYVSKIDEALQSDLVRLRFNQLPAEEVIRFIRDISIAENLNLDDETIKAIQSSYGSDMRSMINHIQSNMDMGFSLQVADASIWSNLFTQNNNIENLETNIHQISRQLGLDLRTALSSLLDFLIKNQDPKINHSSLKQIAQIMHLPDPLPDFSLHIFCRALCSKS